MMDHFFRFPQTPHMAWLGESQPRDDKVMSEVELEDFLSQNLILEEKIDGANLGFSIDANGELQSQNRGSFLTGVVHSQFSKLQDWLRYGRRGEAIAEAIFPNLMLFGEWCYARHSIYYNSLPDLFVAFDVYDREIGEFWSVSRRDAFCEALNIFCVPRVAVGFFDLARIKELLHHRSRYGDFPAEGLYVRCDGKEYLRQRAKIVRPTFTQSIEEHWSSRPITPNRFLTTSHH